MKQNKQTTNFGHKKVALDDKQDMVNQVFDNVAVRYDLMNDLMSFGVHRLWKDAMVARLAPPKKGTRPFRVLDMAGGTGDIAKRIINASIGHAELIVADINEEMLAQGKINAKNWRYPDQVKFVAANAEKLPFESNYFDAYTISFGIRNVPRIDVALEEAFRVLKRGGRLLVLEFSSVDVAGLDRIYEKFSNNIIPFLGDIVTRDKAAYKYLVESIEQFPNPDEFSNMIEQAGFSKITHTAFSGNIAALHSAWKI